MEVLKQNSAGPFVFMNRTHEIQIEDYSIFIEADNCIVVTDWMEEKFIVIESKEQLKQLVSGLLSLSFKVGEWKE